LKDEFVAILARSYPLHGELPEGLAEKYRLLEEALRKSPRSLIQEIENDELAW